MRGCPEDKLDGNKRTRLRSKAKPKETSGEPKMATMRSEQGGREAREKLTGIQIQIVLHLCSGVHIRNDSP